MAVHMGRKRAGLGVPPVPGGGCPPGSRQSRSVPAGPPGGARRPTAPLTPLRVGTGARVSVGCAGAARESMRCTPARSARSFQTPCALLPNPLRGSPGGPEQTGRRPPTSSNGDRKCVAPPAQVVRAHWECVAPGVEVCAPPPETRRRGGGRASHGLGNLFRGVGGRRTPSGSLCRPLGNPRTANRECRTVIGECGAVIGEAGAVIGEAGAVIGEAGVVIGEAGAASGDVGAVIGDVRAGGREWFTALAEGRATKRAVCAPKWEGQAPACRLFTPKSPRSPAKVGPPIPLCALAPPRALSCLRPAATIMQFSLSHPDAVWFPKARTYRD